MKKLSMVHRRVLDDAQADIGALYRTFHISEQVGLKMRNMLLGSDLEHMNDAELAKAAETTDVFAKLTPDQKARVVSVLRQNGHTVGFMGDGINDAAAMKAADIGISVDTAVDVAKESADIILLEKDLMVLEQGIIEGRKTYANMIKYIKMTASSNFGNMFSVLAASALLPFLPMMSLHLILLNLIYDLSCTAIPWDNVDEEFIAKPRKWDASSVGNFMLWIGPTSSIFDFTTYLFMYFVFCPLFISGGVLFNDLPAHFSGMELAMMQAKYIGMFQAGWFVESMWSQTLVIHIIRTPKLPFIQSRASAPLTLLTLTGITVLTIIPFTPLWRRAGLCRAAGCILCLSHPLHSAVYGPGNQPQKGLCPALWGTALKPGGVRYEMDDDLDGSLWHHIHAGDQYGLLGGHGGGAADCDWDERGILGHEAETEPLSRCPAA